MRIFAGMKKIVAIITLVFYFSLSVVQAVSLHFCHGEFESLYFTSERSACCATTHTDHSTCCKDITIEVKFDTDHLVSGTINVQDSPDVLCMVHYLNTSGIFDSQEDNLPEFDYADKIPPPKLYLVQHSLLFYS